jgi:hypothetical protein
MGIRSLARQRDLYTIFAGGKEGDDFERWLNVEFEHRGLEAIDRLISGSKLTPEDWHSMIRLLAIQDLRTPLAYIEMIERWRLTLPDLLKRTLQDSKRRLEEASERGVELTEQLVQNEFAGIIKVNIEPSDNPRLGKSILRSEVPVGRRLWIAAVRHLTRTAKILCNHRWSVAEPHGDAEWPLTDHPVLKLNYHGPGRYDFGGGWGSLDTEIMMPVSPRHLLFVHVGRKLDNRFAFSAKNTQLVQRLLVERAHRWVFATRQEEWITKVRSRIVDPEMFAADEKAWEEFHRDQSRSEDSSGRGCGGGSNCKGKSPINFSTEIEKGSGDVS